MGKKTLYVSPPGRAVYPHLLKEDPEYGGWKTGLTFDPEIISAEKARLEEKYAKDIKANKNFKLPIKTTKDGMEYLHFTSKYRPLVLDIKKEPVDPEKTQIWGGSILRCAAMEDYTAEGKYAGVKLRLNKVLLIKSVGGDDSFGDEDYSAYTGSASEPDDDFGDTDVQSSSKLDI